MKKKLIIRPYKLGSKGARLLAAAMSSILPYRVLRVSTGYVPRRNEVVINWGNNKPYWSDSSDSNSEPKKATNKLEAFKAFKEAGVSCPEFTTSKEEATVWLESGDVVIERHTLTGNSGAGIRVVEPGQTLMSAPLYTKYKKKKKEFRAHVAFGECFEVVEKRKRRGYEHVDTKIRNHQNGWVFCRDGVVIPADISNVAVAAVSSLGLNFGAVDLIWNEKEDKCYALEVNTAPGIEGSTVQQYAQAFVQALGV